PSGVWKDVLLQNPKDRDSHLNGIKIASGFEILVCRYLNGGGATTPQNSEDRFTGVDGDLWQRFVSNLKAHGFFGDETVGSKKYCQQLDKCKSFFNQSFDRNLPDNTDQCVGGQIYDFVTNVKIDEAEFDQIPLEQADDDSWIRVDPNELD